MNIRAITPEDAKSVEILMKQLGYDVSQNMLAENINKINHNDGHVAVVAVHSNEIMGVIHGFKTLTITSASELEISSLVVKENLRRKGNGRELLEAITSDHPCSRVRCNIAREKAHQFYLNNGFNVSKQQIVFTYRT